MRTAAIRPVLATLAVAGITALISTSAIAIATATAAQAAAPAPAPVAVPAAVAAAALPAAEPSPSPGASTVTRAGTSFLGATAIAFGQPVSVAAATGEYLYWSFTASAGEIYEVVATVTLPPADGRHGAQTWIIEAFDGLRRRQACVAGKQSAVAAASDSQVSLRCTLRQIRSWAEPWSGDPLPGSFYLRLSTSQLPEQDLGQPAQVELLLGMETGSVTADDGELAAPLAPVTKAGTVTKANTDGDPTATEEDDDSSFDLPSLPDLPNLSARWFWTAGGGVLAALTGVLGFALTRRSRTTTT